MVPHVIANPDVRLFQEVFHGCFFVMTSVLLVTKSKTIYFVIHEKLCFVEDTVMFKYTILSQKVWIDFNETVRSKPSKIIVTES